MSHNRNPGGVNQHGAIRITCKLSDEKVSNRRVLFSVFDIVDQGRQDPLDESVGGIRSITR